MKNCNTITKEILIFIFIVAVFVFPPIFTRTMPQIPARSESIYDLIVVIFWFFVSASYEEIIYRWYLPTRLHLFYTCSSRKKTLFGTIALESIPVSLFALGHLYNGIGSVIYACIMGCIFRIIFIKIPKTKIALVTTIIIHTVHNCIVFFLIL